MVAWAPKLEGCDVCGVSHFLQESARDFHMKSDAAHRVRLLCFMRKSVVPSDNVTPVEPDSIVNVLRNFRHLPLLGHHGCLECGLIVEVTPLNDFHALVNSLNTHLISRDHKHVKFHTKSDPWHVEELGCLPKDTVTLDHDKYICYRCQSYPEFASFTSLCLHVSTAHAPLLPQKRKVAKSEGFSEPMPDYFKANNDEWGSYTCTLCNVTVWNDSDPHLTGKRHLKALRNLSFDGMDSRFTSEC